MGHMRRMSAAAANAIRINAIVIVLACCCSSVPAWAVIDCMSAPGEPKAGARYFWREIDGRKCWFLKTGDIPPKSQLRWPAKGRNEARPIPASTPVEKRRSVAVEPQSFEPPPVEPAAVPPAGETASRPEPVAQSQLRFKTARVRPVTLQSLNLGHGLDLMSGTSLTANTPPSLAPADPFHARFTGRSD
jgi:hypothetical protein